MSNRIDIRLTPLQVVTLQMDIVGMGRCRTSNCENWTSAEFCARCEEELTGQYVSARRLLMTETERIAHRVMDRWQQYPHTNLLIKKPSIFRNLGRIVGFSALVAVSIYMLIAW